MTRPRKRPDRTEILTIEDVQEAPNGTATVYQVEHVNEPGRSHLATLDDHGGLRALDTDRSIFPVRDWEVAGPWEGRR